LEVRITKLGEKFVVRVSERWEHFETLESLGAVLSYLTTINWEAEHPLKDAGVRDEVGGHDSGSLS